jgi:hypothetical protein
MEILMEKHHNTNLHDSGGNIATASWYNLYNLPYLSDGQPSIVEFQSWDQVPQLDQISEISVVHTPQEEFVICDFEFEEAFAFPASWDETLRRGFVWDVDMSWWYAHRRLEHLIRKRQRLDETKWIELGDILPNIERNVLLEQGVTGGKERGKGACEYINMNAPMDGKEANRRAGAGDLGVH